MWPWGHTWGELLAVGGFDSGIVANAAFVCDPGSVNYALYLPHA
jgi:hypothetical protein